MAESTGDSAKLTSNEEIDAFQAGDNTIEIVAYVDCVEGTKYVGKNNKALFKFIINNGNGRRMRVLLWEQIAHTYESKIVNREIVHLERGMYIPVNPTYYRKEDNVIPFELSMSKNSRIQLLGKYLIKETEVYEIISTTIENCINVKGKIYVEGFIKVMFSQVSTTYSSYGSGAIMDGIYKLRIHISNFTENPALIKGAHVQLHGEIKRDKYGSIYLHVENVDDIKLLDEKLLPIQELNKGIYTPQKRQRENEPNVDEAEPPLSKQRVGDDSEILAKLTFEDDEDDL